MTQSAPIGPPFKLNSDELKNEAYDQFCAHIASGHSVESWYFDHPDLTITYKTMLNYIKEYPELFPPAKKEMALAKSLRKWESVVHASADGTNTKASTASLQMLMRNKFGWDKPAPLVSVDSVEVTLTHDRLMNQIELAQRKALEAQEVLKIADTSINVEHKS
jgi:hypothetical protein